MPVSGGSVSPIDVDSNEDNNQSSGGDHGVNGEESGSNWEKMMEPFDQDKEEKEKEEEDNIEEDMWQEAFGDGANEESKVKAIREGHAPTASEVKQHMVNHLPFRSWCRHCVKGKAKGLPHRIKKREDKEAEQVPLVSVDYMFMGIPLSSLAP